MKTQKTPTKAAKRLKDEGLSVRTLRVRVKDRHAGEFQAMAKDVNMVWNFDNELSAKVLEREHRFLSAYDLDEYTKGATKAGLNLPSQTVQAINEEFVTRRKQFKKAKLRWRVSKGSRRSLGWIPFKASAIRYRGGQIFFTGIDRPISLWDSYGLSNYELGPGSMSEDARGRWYLNITVKTKKAAPSVGKGDIGIDLGLKTFAGLSNGEEIEAKRFYRDLEPKLAIAQKAGHKNRVRSIHAKIANRRKDFLHKLSSDLVSRFGMIIVGNVNAAGLAKTTMAKSVLDAGWSTLRTMLQYKSDDAGVWFEEVSEAYSTQDCSTCSMRSGPKGLKDLGVREWVCPGCGVSHKRDINAAKNILAAGHRRLAVGIPTL